MTDSDRKPGAERARKALGERAEAMLRAAAAISVPGPGVTRLPFTDEHRRAAELIEAWMRDARLTPRRDAAGTIIGRREGAFRDAPALLLGSHQDSVREGGAYDGMMGIALPILALGALRDAALPFAVEVLAFADEEGVRFPTALLGSRALAGTAPADAPGMRDRDGVSLAAALRDFGGDPDALGGLARRPEDVLGFVETHIEQGPALEAAGAPLGVVTAIAGIERHAVEITGEAGHAGTVPMALRRDALCAAAELVGAVERICRESVGVVGTVGALEVSPNAINAIPGAVRLTVELRSAEDERREAARLCVAEAAREAATARGCALAMEMTYAQPAQACDAALMEDLEAAVAETVEAVEATPMRLMSGATHDASAMADLAPMAMLFVRCRGGVSHRPDEHADAADMGLAAEALRRFVLRRAGRAR